jgi:hypothetical protein
MDNLQPSHKILHNWYGPCDVTFVGAEYIGICTAEGQHALIRKDPEQFCLWGEAAEAEWRNT